MPRNFSTGSRIKVTLRDVNEAVNLKLNQNDKNDKTALVEKLFNNAFDAIDAFQEEFGDALYTYTSSSGDNYMNVYDFVPMDKDLFMDENAREFWSEEFDWENESVGTLVAMITKKLTCLAYFLTKKGPKVDTGRTTDYHYTTYIDDEHREAKDHLLNVCIPSIRESLNEFHVAVDKINVVKQQKYEESRKAYLQKREESKQAYLQKKEAYKNRHAIKAAEEKLAKEKKDKERLVQIERNSMPQVIQYMPITNASLVKK
jgi:hypothetical protein